MEKRLEIELLIASQWATLTRESFTETVTSNVVPARIPRFRFFDFDICFFLLLATPSSQVASIQRLFRQLQLQLEVPNLTDCDVASRREAGSSKSSFPASARHQLAPLCFCSGTQVDGAMPSDVEEN